MTVSQRCDAILCDIDGVLRHWPSAADLERAHGLPVGAFTATAFAPQRLQPAITGQISDEQWRLDIASDLAESCGSAEQARIAVTAWSDLLPNIDSDVVALLTQARDCAFVGLVSNGTTRLERDLEQQGLGALAHTVVNSARVGITKPDPRIYLIAAERAGVAAHRCLFIDDAAVNVAAARDLGMAAIHYRQITDLQEALNSVLPG